MLDLAVSIVTYCNPQEQLLRAVRSVLRSNLEFRLTVVDNSPTDEIRGFLPESPHLQYRHCPTNPGFGKAHNLVMAESVGLAKYHLVLNPDVTFDPTILGRLTDLLDANPRVGLVSPKVLYPNGDLQTLCKLLPTPWDVFARRMFPNSAWIARRNEQYELRFSGYNKPMNVPSLTGAFLFIRTQALAEVGLFDERFFMYFEDTDLCRRIHRTHLTAFFPDCSIIHEYEKGSYHNRRLLIIHIKSALRYFCKWGWFLDPERRRVNRATLLEAVAPLNLVPPEDSNATAMPLPGE